LLLPLFIMAQVAGYRPGSLAGLPFDPVTVDAKRVHHLLIGKLSLRFERFDAVGSFREEFMTGLAVGQSALVLPVGEADIAPGATENHYLLGARIFTPARRGNQKCNFTSA